MANTGERVKPEQRIKTKSILVTIKVMKRIYYIIVPLFILVSCENKIELTKNIEDFDVYVENSTVKAGEKVVFKFNGNPEIISFYSDEPFHDYDSILGRIVSFDSLNLTFDYRMQTKIASNNKPILSVLVSTDFNDQLDYENITNANWIDITDRFTLLASTSVQLNAGVVNLKEVVQGNQSIHFAFRYLCDVQYNCLCYIYAVKLYASSVEIPLYMLGEMSTDTKKEFLSPVILKDPDQDPPKTSYPYWFSLASTRGIPQESWVVSQKISSGTTIDVGRDYPIPIKGLFTGATTDFTYVYNTPGTYHAYFIAKNVNIDGEKQVVRDLTITVVE